MIFLLADFVLSTDRCPSLPTDLLVCMQNKIVRRLRKLADAASESLVMTATEAIRKAKDVLDTRWNHIKTQQAISPDWSPEALNVSQDTNISLLSSKGYLSRRLQRPTPLLAKPNFAPSEIHHLNDDDILLPVNIDKALSRDPFVALADVEEFAVNRLDAWVFQHYSDSSSTCVALGKTIIIYAESGTKHYKSSPEDQSLMLLTIVLLWSALDRLAIRQHPSLADYSPEIPTGILDPILLRKRDSIDALICVRKYIFTRHSHAHYGSVFSDKLSSSSFSIRYFCSSQSLMELKRDIEVTAQARRDEKRREFDRNRREYDKLVSEAQWMDHNENSSGYHRGWSCSKCLKEQQAYNMTISVHEWPLPQEALFAQATVFELQCPLAFQAWRTTTYTVLYDFFRPVSIAINGRSPKAGTTLANYRDLQAYCHSQTRITYASSTRSFTMTHYSSQKIAHASRDGSSVMVNNGLQYHLFDSVLERSVEESFGNCDIEKLCRFTLSSSSPYFALQYAMQGTTHSANQPIADQGDVRPELTLHEHIAFGILRGGPVLQWFNILRELRARTLSFDRFEVHLLLTQAALQTGSIEADNLEWHDVLKKPEFGRALLSEIDDLISSVESNWHHIYTLHTTIILVSRLLACSLEDDVIEHACSTLRTARKVAFSWVAILTEDIKRSDDEGELTHMRDRLCLAAATCRAVYDVDPQYIDRLLETDEDVNVLIQCAVQVQDCTPLGNITTELGVFLARDRRMSCKLVPILWARIEARRKGLDDAIVAIWSAYKPGSNWKVLDAPNERWLTSVISDVSTTVQSILHYNLLNGTLLIDGKPLGRLPSSIVQHSTYIRLLGHKRLDVIPSTLPAMKFSTRSAIFTSDLFLHFQLPDNDGNLIIQAEVGPCIYELVPHTIFTRPSGCDFPSSFINNYTHWLCLSPPNVGNITFHPLNSGWKPSEHNWSLNFAPGTSSWRMKSADSVMVDIRSETFRLVSKRLEPLEVPHNVHVVLDTKNTLLVELPRLKMLFFINSNNELECSTISNMIVDLNQSTGTMFGLFNQLVLRDKSPRMTRTSAPGSRCVIVPFGKLSFQDSPYHHTTVKISHSIGKFFIYQIDTTLERLIGTTLLSELYKIYLHGCTSFPLPDDLTGRTGTEEALHELESARYFSFKDLGAEEVSVLHHIASLTPGYVWYPEHLKAMQTAHWTALNPLAQHWAFTFRVEDVLQFHQQLNSIDIGTKRNSLPVRSDPHLLTRLGSRTSGLYASGRKPPLLYSDITYSSSEISRIIRSTSPEQTNLLAANVSAFARDAAGELDTVPDLWERLHAVTVLKNNEPDGTDSYRNFMSPSLTDLFLALYEFCRKERPSGAVSYRMAFALSTMVYTSTRDHQFKRLVPTFLSFLRLPDFRCIDPPSPREFDLSCGLRPDEKTLIHIVQKYSLPPPLDQPIRRSDENDYQYDKRHTTYWGSIISKEVKQVVDCLVQQWPCEAPCIPRHSNFNAIDLCSAELGHNIYQHFLTWFNNMKFRGFVHQIQAVLDRVHVSLSAPIPSTKVPYLIPSLPCKSLTAPRHLPTTLDDLIHRYLPHDVPTLSRSSSFKGTITQHSAKADSSRLSSLVEQFKQGPAPLQQVYGHALEKSLKSHLKMTASQMTQIKSSAVLLFSEYELRRREFNNICQSIRKALAPRTSLETAEALAGQWPNPTNTSLLRLLSKDKIRGIQLAWKNAVTTLAQAMVKLQRSRRLVLFKSSGREEDVLKELENVEYEADVSFSRPEWLLIQIDSNFTVRPVQSRVAQQLISPRSGQNSLTQLNMGEGKSAVIVPLVSSELANGQRLVRVVTLKPLVNQTLDVLVRRLSGLANRRIFYLPFSRDFRPENLRQLQELYTTCVHEGGILIIQPEHILSFRLMGIDLTIGTRMKAAETLLNSYRWLTSVSRDVLDESDEILRATYQLVYTSGLQQPMDNHPDRWTIIQEVIGYAMKHACILHQKSPDALEVQYVGEIGCPIVRILDIKAGVLLIDSVIFEVLSSERFKLFPAHVRVAASDFVRGHRGNSDALQTLRSFVHDASAWKHLLLFRGFLGHGLLRFVLQEKRWRVDYGLDLTRTLLAVPYHAKDLPSLRADFGHPDVALALTCLSYYYGGLTEEQLHQCFELLFKLDDPPLEYNQWVSGQDQIPLSFRDIKGINLDDHDQRKSILGPLFRKNKAVVDFYLSNVVFPRYAKQFPKKLSTSSWDLAETKGQVTTGFSGTNDNRYLLPTSIEQDDTTAVGEQDPFGQLATNAK
ncbi:hypothetical protein C0991_012190, partial [Blastosporella zonata]